MRLLRYVLTFMLLTMTMMAAARDLPSHPTDYVNDYAGMLSATTRQALDQKLRQFDHQTTNQITVVTINSLDGDTIEDAATQLEDKWKIGTKKNDNGVIVLIAKKEHRARIEVGYGLESRLTDAISGDIIRTKMTPNFKNGNYDAGINQTVAAIMAATKGAYKPAHQSNSDDGSYIGNLAGTLIFWLVVGIMFYGFISALAGKGGGGGSGDGGFFSGGGFSGGGGDGGFSGGGGSSGGGGASGSW